MRQIHPEQCEPITADDATIAAALEDAHIPTLMAALVHITGDASLVRGEIRPNNAMLADPQGGIAPEQQAEIRALALEALKRYRDEGCRLPPPPSEETLRDVMNFMVGDIVSEEYVAFLTSELALSGDRPDVQAILEDIPAHTRDDFNVVVIGAGMSGILAAIRLKQAGIPYLVIEKNPELGGTWYENSYPGCRVDSPNHGYSYSFAPTDWPQYFSDRNVLHGYFDQVASEHGIKERIRFETEVEAAHWDEESARWRLELRGPDGGHETLTANAVVSAVGQLNRPRYPDIPGGERFRGPAFHSARWRHDLDLTGKRVAVIGTGASAFQFVPEIAPRVAELKVFQRTPPWVAPTPEYHDYVPEGKHWLLRHVPYYGKWYRFLVFWRSAEGLLQAVTVDPEWDGREGTISARNHELRRLLVQNMESIIGDDPELLEKALPKYPPGGKRMLRDNGTWLRALQRDNVELITEPIEVITPEGLVTVDGTAHEIDVLIYGTGFQANRFLYPMHITGRGGRVLAERWGEDPRAYMGITVPEFPNLFLLYGPNTNIVVNGSIIFFSECEMRYILGCLKLLLETGHRSLECREGVHDAYNERIDAGNARMAWGLPGINSWYKNARGRVTQNWPFTLLEFWQQTRAPDPADYQLD